MVSIPIGLSDWRRGVGQEPDVALRNRYFEEDPSNQVDQVALLARPGLKRFLNVGEGPIRAWYSQPGSFDDAMFVVSYASLYRVDQDNSVASIGSGIWGSSLRASVSMAATGRIGSTPEMLYIADGRILWLYMANSYAIGTLATSGAIATGDKIEIGGVYYQWTSGDVNAGAPAGTNANPWLVALGSSNADALSNLMLAIDALGSGGVTYSTALTAHPSAQSRASTATLAVVQARDAGATGNAITTTVSVGANIAWESATLTGGGDPTMTQVQVPDGLGVISVCFIAGYIICVVAQGEGYNGRFYWIEPGETFIDPLNFATAERSPDGLWSARTVGDQFWLLGIDSTEPWYPTGDGAIPFLRVQGRVFDRGVWEGTDVVINDEVFVTGADGVVFVIGASPLRVSNNSIEERIRRAMKRQVESPL